MLTETVKLCVTNINELKEGKPAAKEKGAPEKIKAKNNGSLIDWPYLNEKFDLSEPKGFSLRKVEQNQDYFKDILQPWETKNYET